LKWEYSFYDATIAHVDALWKKRILDDKNSRTTAEIIRDYGREGWELVSVAPFSYVSGCTSSLLFTFKRPVAEAERSVQGFRKEQD